MADSTISDCPGRKVTSAIIESHLKCRRKSGLLLAGERGTKSDYEVLLTEDRESAAAAATRKLVFDSKEPVPTDLVGSKAGAGCSMEARTESLAALRRAGEVGCPRGRR